MGGRRRGLYAHPAEALSRPRTSAARPPGDAGLALLEIRRGRGTAARTPAPGRRRGRRPPSQTQRPESRSGVAKGGLGLATSLVWPRCGHAVAGPSVPLSLRDPSSPLGVPAGNLSRSLPAAAQPKLGSESARRPGWWFPGRQARPSSRRPRPSKSSPLGGGFSGVMNFGSALGSLFFPRPLSFHSVLYAAWQGPLAHSEA